MLYFGGGGVKGRLHASLKAYIDSFCSAPFPKQFPRGGGVWDQDPLLMRDFRVIIKFEREWKEIQDHARNPEGNKSGGGALGVEDALNEYIESMGEDAQF